MAEAITQPNNARQQLIDMARHNLGVQKAGQLDLTEDVLRVPGHHYYDAERGAMEVRQVFKRLPLMLAMSCELREAGDYKTMNIAGVPVLLARDEQGDVQAFVNSCKHRGAVIMTERSGNAKRFTCPYHAWSYSHDGELIAIYREGEFGAIDKSCHGLDRLPVAERGGMIWVNLDPNTQLDFDTYLCGYDEVLAEFGFEDWLLFEHRTLKGPNWKIAYDGYMDFYHLPILHRDTFGPDMSSQALYYAWGPHQRVSAPNPGLLELEQTPESSWPTPRLMESVWTIFPHISIAGFDGGGGRGVMISQLFPGEDAQTSYTVQNYLLEKAPATDEMRQAAHEQFKFLEYVVQEEDYATGIRQQEALMSRPDAEVLFGRNEGGGQRFHRLLDRLLSCEDQDLEALFGGMGSPDAS